MVAVSCSRVRVASVTSVDAPSNCTLMIAIDSSSLTALPAYSLNGLTTESMPSTPSIAVTIRSMVASLSASVTDAPEGASTTTCALAPATEGNTASSRSRAFCDSVPGMLNDSLVCPPSAMLPPSIPTSTSTQTPIVRHACRYEKRPSR
jgi:hypothetical protein